MPPIVHASIDDNLKLKLLNILLYRILLLVIIDLLSSMIRAEIKKINIIIII